MLSIGVYSLVRQDRVDSWLRSRSFYMLLRFPVGLLMGNNTKLITRFKVQVGRHFNNKKCSVLALGSHLSNS